ncbi:putative aldouronate transport system permease protein [Paenibacillus sp. UNCCL117]|uniref:carbohydrate ABC transporter permease n=1 Tax=unclassified Paenibacillus TaxID=185978 RepID=UPI0008836074|nr:MULTISPECIES: carbohydrate ABC transporter permease [unclassified Paenibacillus]SDE11344.1 putative aldouronate transport system permease protein [Paenibacillus sp. cl123]SFW59968.1 putative aldouronate transport system permease protein [Paenibacillus sp. UNCCL117]
MSFVIQRHRTKGDKAADAAIYTVLALFALATLFPLYYVVIVSVTPYVEVMRNGGFVIWPEQFTFKAYEEIFGSPRIPQALKITVFITVVGTALNLAVTTLLAYPLSKKHIPGRNFILMALVFTMIFSGGIIPLYIVVRSLGLYDSVWALIIPGMVSTFNLLIVKTYFENLPSEVEEAAKVDGCGDVTTLYRIVLPLSAPIMATIGLFYGVTHWNEYFKGIFYLSDKTLMPMQVVLRSMIQSPNVSTELSLNFLEMDTLPPETVKMAVVVVATLPLMVIYPFLQKYFIKGALLGSVKG